MEKRNTVEQQYKKVTDQVVEYIEKNGKLPWRNPVITAGNNALSPRNYFTGHEYQGINMLVCSLKGYESPYWMTANAMKGFNAKMKSEGKTDRMVIRKGERSTKVLYFFKNQYEIKRIMADDRLDEEEKKRKIDQLWLIPRVHSVFNAEQVEGFDFPEVKLEAPKDFEPIKAAEEVVANMPLRPEIVHTGSRMYYRPATDTVTVPKPEHFVSREEYYAGLLHELGHSTGHSKRLGWDREDSSDSFKINKYGFNELVVELSATMILNELHINTEDTFKNSSAYLAGWVKTIKEQPKILYKAMKQAIPAVNYIFNRIEGMKQTA